jgi:hypothetical protein
MNLEMMIPRIQTVADSKTSPTRAQLKKDVSLTLRHGTRNDSVSMDRLMIAKEFAHRDSSTPWSKDFEYYLIILHCFSKFGGLRVILCVSVV